MSMRFFLSRPFTQSRSLHINRQSLLMGACIAPTDPVVSSAVVQSVLAIKLVPSRVRNTIISGII